MNILDQIYEENTLRYLFLSFKIFRISKVKQHATTMNTTHHHNKVRTYLFLKHLVYNALIVPECNFQAIQEDNTDKKLFRSDYITLQQLEQIFDFNALIFRSSSSTISFMVLLQTTTT